MKMIFDDGRILVRTNDSGEVFVSIKKSENQSPQPQIRVGIHGQGLSVTAQRCNWEPTTFNGLGGFFVTHN
jgi:hypothetical protein